MGKTGTDAEKNYHYCEAHKPDVFAQGGWKADLYGNLQKGIVMISAIPTEKLTGVTVQGDLSDFYELVDAIYRITGLENADRDLFWGVKNRLLGVCYDIRHAYMGDRNVLFVDNGMDDEKMKWHSMITPKQNVYYSAEILFPEAVFLAAAVPSILEYSCIYYGPNGRCTDPDWVPLPYSYYLKDKGMIQTLCGAIWQALDEVIGVDETYKLLCTNNRRDGYGYGDYKYADYVTMYIDKCNIEYLKTPLEKRPDKIRNIAKRIITKPAAYMKMENEMKECAQKYGCSIYDLKRDDLKYPEEIEW